MTRIVLAWLGLLLTVGLVHSTGGDEPPVSETTAETSPLERKQSTAAVPADSAELPIAFTKAVPESLDDLRSIENLVTQLVPPLKQCTVNLRIGAAQGSGVIVSADGLILTAAHVVGRPSRRVSVIFDNGEQVVGRVLGRNQTLDAAMVQIESDRKDWPHCKVGRYEDVKLGDWCLVLGHPGGYLQERGLVTRLGRVIQKTRWYLQSDCELVGGDSGGPIFNMRGELIGINSRIGEETDANFHVPIAAYSADWDRYLAGEDFKSHSGAYLGISGDTVAGGNGVRLTDVYRNTPAAQAGLKIGDIVITVESKKVSSIEEISRLIGEQFPGEVVRLEILRDGKPQTLTVRLGMKFE